MYACDRCGKGALVGMKVSHSHHRTKKRSYPNLHRTTLVLGGQRRSMKLCTKCLRTLKEQVDTRPVRRMEAVGATSAAAETSPRSKRKIKIVSVEKKESHTLSEDIEKAVSKKVKESAEASKS